MDNTEPIITEIINEDGTSMDDYPKNPLQEKWDRLYPAIPKPEFGQVCDDYSCIWCDRCPKGWHWKVPEEDKKVYKKYQKQVYEYHKIHNPTIFALSNPESASESFTEMLFKDIHIKEE